MWAAVLADPTRAEVQGTGGRLHGEFARRLAAGPAEPSLDGSCFEGMTLPR